MLPIDRRAPRGSRPNPLHGVRAAIGRAARLAACLVVAASAHAGAPGPEPEDAPEPIRVDETQATSASVAGVRDPAPRPLPTDVRDREDATETPVLAQGGPPNAASESASPRPVLDPAARLLGDDAASEAWTLFLELESGHRITQRFLLTNMGPGKHSAVAVGHLVEPGRAPYRYANGRRRSRWTLSEDRLFFDIAASHLDLHRPRGELRITKDDIELRFFFDFAKTAPAVRLPADRMPPDYHVDVLAVGAPAQGTILAPWMSDALATRGRAWLVHTWTPRAEADQLARRIDLYGADAQTSFYGIQLAGHGDWRSGWWIGVDPRGRIIESVINVPSHWNELPDTQQQTAHPRYPSPRAFEIRSGKASGEIALEREWLRFDPLEVIPQPFRWFIRRASQPQEVWADARIGGSLFFAPDPPSLPRTGETQTASTDTNASSEARGSRETEPETAVRSVSGVASVTFLNPVRRR